MSFSPPNVIKDSFNSDIIHRMNNLLQMVQSILNIEKSRNESNPLEALNETRNKIETIAVLYSLLSNKRISNTADIAVYSNKFVQLLQKEDGSRQKINLQMESCLLNHEVLMPFGLFLSEYFYLLKHDKYQNKFIHISGKSTPDKYNVTITSDTKLNDTDKGNRLLYGLAKQMNSELLMDLQGKYHILNINTLQGHLF